MSRWFRHYAGMMRDDKLVRAALKSRQPIERVVWIWGAILESAAEINQDGRFDLDAAEVAYFLRADDADVDAVLRALEELGRTAEGHVVRWGDRQFQSDRSAERQKRYRERRTSERDGDVLPPSRDAGVTVASRHGDAPETETEEDTDNTPQPPSAGGEEGFDEAFASYPQSGRDCTKQDRARKAWSQALERVSPAALIAAVKRYAEGDYVKAGRKVPAFEKWLSDGKWQACLDGPQPVGWLGPAELRRAVCLEATESFARSYLDTSEWTPDGLRPRTRYAFDKLKPLRSLRGVSILEPQGAAA